MFKKLLISCDEATTICDKSQYKEASFFEKVQLNYHILICKVCALYSKQNNKMSRLFKMNCVPEKTNNCMSSEDKEALKERLKNFKV